MVSRKLPEKIPETEKIPERAQKDPSSHSSLQIGSVSFSVVLICFMCFIHRNKKTEHIVSRKQESTESSSLSSSQLLAIADLSVSLPAPKALDHEELISCPEEALLRDTRPRKAWPVLSAAGVRQQQPAQRQQRQRLEEDEHGLRYQQRLAAHTGI